LTAIEARGFLTFYDIDDGQRVFDKSMPLKWAGRGGAVRPLIIHDKRRWGWILTPGGFDPGSTLDIHAGSQARLDVAAKFDDDDECFGWTSENEASIPHWRNPRWKLPKEKYFVKVEVQAANAEVSAVFRLINASHRTSFRLEDPLPTDGHILGQLN
jgi:hypothetical protein